MKNLVNFSKIDHLESGEGTLSAALNEFPRTGKEFFPFAVIPKEHIKTIQEAIVFPGLNKILKKFINQMREKFAKF